MYEYFCKVPQLHTRRSVCNRCQQMAIVCAGVTLLSSHQSPKCSSCNLLPSYTDVGITMNYCQPPFIVDI